MVEDNELVNGGYEPTNKPGGTTFSWPKKPSNEQSSISTPTKKNIQNNMGISMPGVFLFAKRIQKGMDMGQH